jgi:hypothetical protein
MPTINNILAVKIFTVTSAASVNFGTTLNISPHSATTSSGGSEVIGDLGRNIDFETNIPFTPTFGPGQDFAL